MVRVHYDEGVAIHIGPESCAGGREAVLRRPAIEPRKGRYSGCRRRPIRGRPHGGARYRKLPDDPAWSETLACADTLCSGTGLPTNSQGLTWRGGNPARRLISGSHRILIMIAAVRQALRPDQASRCARSRQDRAAYGGGLRPAFDRRCAQRVPIFQAGTEKPRSSRAPRRASDICAIRQAPATPLSWVKP